jgi:hypothetical protein
LKKGFFGESFVEVFYLFALSECGAELSIFSQQYTKSSFLFESLVLSEKRARRGKSGRFQ